MPTDPTATAARRVCENGRHNFGPPPRWPAGVGPMECQCHRLMLGYYRDNGEAFVYVVTTVDASRRPPDPGKAECCGATETSGHKPWCITVLGYWRWLLFGWRHREGTGITPDSARSVRRD